METQRAASRILVVDDDCQLCRFLEKFLAREGYTAATVHDGQSMRRALSDQLFALVLLDLSFASGDDGVSLARTLRAQYDMPLIILSGKSAMTDKVVGLEVGADDYVTKPFEPRELLARIRAVLRRAARQIETTGPERESAEASVITFAGWRLNIQQSLLLSPEEEVVKLTSREFEVLAALASRRGRILSREQLLDIVASRRWWPNDRSIDMLVSKIRRKTGSASREGSPIKTVRGIGYVFAAPPSDARQ